MAPRYCPVYPRPIRRRWTAWWRLLFGNGSLLDQITVKGYRMQMGRLRVPGVLTYVVNDPQAVRRVMVEQNAAFPKHPVMDDLLHPLLGRSIFTTNGEAWARQRKLMEPAFESTRMEHAFPRMRAAADALMERLAAWPAGQPCDIEMEMTHFTADTIFRTIFSQPLSADDAKRIFQAFSEFQHATSKATEPRYRPRWWQKLTRGDHAETAARAAGEIRALLRQQVAARHAAYHGGQEDATRTDILAALLEAREADTGRQLDVEELVNEVAVLYLAGHETSASALSWSLYFLAQDPDTQQRVHQELDAVLGNDAARPIEFEQLRALEVTRRVFREALRLYPPLGFLVREAATDTCLRDHQVPAGATVVVSPWIIQRHQRYWERPDEFDPDRYLTEAGRASAAQAWLPFSIGPRVCVGAGFALQEAVLVLATVLRRYSVAPTPGRQPRPVARLTLRSDIGVRLMLQRR